MRRLEHSLRDIAGAQRRDHLPEGGLVGERFDVQQRHRQQLVAAVAGLPHGALVHIGKAERLRVEDEDAVADRVEKPEGQARALFGEGQRASGSGARGG